VAASFAAGVVIYVISRSRQKARGLDLSLVFREIPPE
jgi:hypothetical protein